MSWTSEHEQEYDHQQPYEPTEKELLEMRRMVEENFFHLSYRNFIELSNKFCTNSLLGWVVGMSQDAHECGSPVVWLAVDIYGQVNIMGCYVCHTPTAFYTDN